MGTAFGGFVREFIGRLLDTAVAPTIAPARPLARFASSGHNRRMVILLTGVSGVGKTTLGTLLARSLGWPFYDADDLHPAANQEKMRRGIPLTDADRWPWLNSVRRLIQRCRDENRNAVVACSALKRSYRNFLVIDPAVVKLVYLKGAPDLIRDRLEARSHPFMPAALLRSQFDTLEEPSAEPAVIVDVSAAPADVVAAIRSQLGF